MRILFMWLINIHEQVRLTGGRRLVAKHRLLLLLSLSTVAYSADMYLLVY